MLKALSKAHRHKNCVRAHEHDLRSFIHTRPNAIDGTRHALPLVFATSSCPRNSRVTDGVMPCKRRFSVPRHGLSTNSPWSWIFHVREHAEADTVHASGPHCARSLSAVSANNPRAVRQPSRVAGTQHSHALVLSLVRMITFDQPATAREAVPADCTARCAPSRSSSLRCGPPLTARAPPPAWPLRFHARAIHFWQLNRRTFKNMSSRKVRNFCKHSKRQMPVDIPGNVRLRRTPKFRFSPWYFRSRDSKNHHHVEASLGGGSREVNP